MYSQSDIVELSQALERRVGTLNHFEKAGLPRESHIAVLCHMVLSDGQEQRHKWHHSDEIEAGGLVPGGVLMDAFIVHCLMSGISSIEQGAQVERMVFHHLPVNQGVVLEVVNLSNKRFPEGMFGITIGMSSRNDGRYGQRRALHLCVPTQPGVEENCYVIADWHQVGRILFDEVRQLY